MQNVVIMMVITLVKLIKSFSKSELSLKIHDQDLS